MSKVEVDGVLTYRDSGRVGIRIVARLVQDGTVLEGTERDYPRTFETEAEAAEALRKKMEEARDFLTRAAAEERSPYWSTGIINMEPTDASTDIV